MSTLGKRVYRKVPRVRIPLSPPFSLMLTILTLTKYSAYRVLIDFKPQNNELKSRIYLFSACYSSATTAINEFASLIATIAMCKATS